MNKKVYIYDLESYPNFFLAMFKEKITGKYIWFEISSRINQFKELKQYLLNDVQGLVGFNNLNYDYPMLHHNILTVNNNTSENIFKKSNEIINSKYSSIWDNQIIVPQLDLFKINHYDNKARYTSLKWLEFAMRLENVEDLPYKVGNILTEEQMNHVIEYCKNDIEATDEFYKRNKNNISFRENMTKELNHNVMNYSDVKIGEYINQTTYEKISGRRYNDFKDLRTYRDKFEVKHLIPDYICFKTEYLQNFLKEIKNDVFYLKEKDEDSYTKILHFANIEIVIKKGGIHSKDKALDIRINDNEILQEKDVGSMYPASIINGKLYPEHLGEDWYKGIKYLYDDRLYNIKPQLKNHKKGSFEYDFLDSKQSAYKLAMNGGGYGKTGSDFSWQYDPMVVMKTTFKGQLSLLMLCESLYLAGIEIISLNTDGIVIKYNKELKPIVDSIHKEWEEITSYLLEDTNYSRIVYRDVNNYLAFIIDEKGNHLKYKFKGIFEIDCDYHKNHSKRIVPIALANYFINNISIEDTIYKHLNKEEYSFAINYGIYDFCIGAKMIGGNKLVGRSYSKDGIKEKELSKMTRYYVSNGGLDLIKKLPPLEKNKLTETDKYKQKFDSRQMNIFDLIEDVQVEALDREENLEAGYKCTLFNKYFENNYNINYNYYINECNKVINTLNK